MRISTFKFKTGSVSLKVYSVISLRPMSIDGRTQGASGPSIFQTGGHGPSTFFDHPVLK